MMADRAKDVDALTTIAEEFGSNAGYVTGLLAQFQSDAASVAQEWRSYFESLLANGKVGSIKLPLPTTAAPARTEAEAKPAPNVQVLRGAARKLIENMEASLSVPTATSQRQIPIKALDENRRLINEFLSSQHSSKISYTHIIAWAIVKTLAKFPRLNDAFTVINGEPHRL